MKRFIAVLGAVLSLSLMWGSVGDFDSATTTGASLKALFWMIVAVVAFAAFVDDYRKNKWPL